MQRRRLESVRNMQCRRLESVRSLESIRMQRSLASVRQQRRLDSVRVQQRRLESIRMQCLQWVRMQRHLECSLVRLLLLVLLATRCLLAMCWYLMALVVMVIAATGVWVVNKFSRPGGGIFKCKTIPQVFPQELSLGFSSVETAPQERFGGISIVKTSPRKLLSGFSNIKTYFQASKPVRRSAFGGAGGVKPTRARDIGACVGDMGAADGGAAGAEPPRKRTKSGDCAAAKQFAQHNLERAKIALALAEAEAGKRDVELEEASWDDEAVAEARRQEAQDAFWKANEEAEAEEALRQQAEAEALWNSSSAALEHHPYEARDIQKSSSAALDTSSLATLGTSKNRVRPWRLQKSSLATLEPYTN